MKKYEIMYILKANLDDASRNELIGKLNDYLTVDGGTIDNVNEWGLRDLAYPIKKQTKGYYVVIKIQTESADAFKEFDRLSKIDPAVLRYLITVDHE